MSEKFAFRGSIREVSMRRSDLQFRIRCGFVFLVTIALLLVVSPIGKAQEVSAAVTGKITDPSGAVVAGATVTARDVARGTVWTTKTNEEGAYSFTRLPIGKYDVRGEPTG